MSNDSLTMMSHMLHLQQAGQEAEEDAVETLCQGMSKTRSVHNVWVPVELQRIYKGSLKGNRSLLDA